MRALFPLKNTENISFPTLEKIKPSNLYQLFSYLLHQQDGSEKTMNATGILLYSTIDKNYDLDFKYGGHSIRIRTVDLNKNRKDISARLKKIIDE